MQSACTSGPEFDRRQIVVCCICSVQIRCWDETKVRTTVFQVDDEVRYAPKRPVEVFHPIASIAFSLSCKLEVLAPTGDVAAQQRDLLVISTLLMLIIIIPVMALTVLFAWRYRESNRAAVYRPNWDHSTKLELIIWAVPLLIVVSLGAITWVGTHLLDPYRRWRASRLQGDRPAGTAAGPGRGARLEVAVHLSAIRRCRRQRTRRSRRSSGAVHADLVVGDERFLHSPWPA